MNLKQRIAVVLDFIGVTNFLFWISLKLYGQHIRVINYHHTPEKEMGNFEKQLKFFALHYAPVSMYDLERFSVDKYWDKKKPGLIISFDDGYRDNYDYAMPLLEKYNFIGWFFIPSGLIDCSNAEQYEFAGKNKSKFQSVYKGDRILMSWEEIKILSENHVIGCHTLTHHRMSIADNESILSNEIEFSKGILEDKIEKPITAFCWVGGEEHTYTKKAAAKIKSVGYKYAFMTNTYPFTRIQNPFQIQRTNIESINSIAVTKFQLSPLMDLFYMGKRKRVNRITQ